MLRFPGCVGGWQSPGVNVVVGPCSRPLGTIGRAVLAAVLTCGFAGGQDLPAVRDPSGELWRVEPLQGEPCDGGLQEWTADRVTLARRRGSARSTRSYWTDSLLAVRRVGRTPAALRGPLVLLTNGDVLCSHVTQIADDQLTCEWTARTRPVRLELPLELVRSVVLSHPPGAEAADAFRRLWRESRPAADRLLTVDDRIVEGELVGMTGGQIELRTSLGTLQSDTESVRAVVMNAGWLADPPEPGPYTLARLANGSRLSLRSLELRDDSTFEGVSTCGFRVVIPQEDVVTLQPLGDRVMALSDLVPADYRFTPYLSQSMPLMVNANVAGGPLRLRGEEYDVGLGLTSRSEVTYALGPEDGQFRAVVGIDDVASGGGSALFAVELDGIRVFETTCTGRTAPVPVGPIDVTGRTRLTLIVDFANLGNVQDIANWCDAKLIRQPATAPAGDPSETPGPGETE